MTAMCTYNVIFFVQGPVKSPTRRRKRIERRRTHDDDKSSETWERGAGCHRIVQDDMCEWYETYNDIGQWYRYIIALSANSFVYVTDLIM